MWENVVELPGSIYQTATIINHGEHHMSASTIEIHLPFEVHGHSRFFTTNGSAFTSVDNRSLIIHDSLCILYIDCENGTVKHCLGPKNCYMSEVHEYENGLGFKLYGNECKHEAIFISFNDITFETGFGPVQNGQFPSAFQPHTLALLESYSNDH